MKTSKINIINGLSGSSALYYVSQHFQQALIIQPSRLQLNDASRALKFFSKNPQVLSFPEYSPGYDLMREDSQCVYDRLNCLYQCSRLRKNYFVISNTLALSQKTLAPKDLQKAELDLKKTELIDRDEVIRKLKSLGYLQDDIVQDKGFFSVRGHLLDVLSPYLKSGFRIEFFGDEIVSLREFDPENQRSLRELDEISIRACHELYLSDAALEIGKKKLKELGDSRQISREDREHVIWQLENQRDSLLARWLLPAFHDPLGQFFDYLPEEFPIIIINPQACEEEYFSCLKLETNQYESLDRLAYSPKDLRADLVPWLSKATCKIESELSSRGISYNSLEFENLRQSLSKSKSFEPLKRIIEDLTEKSIKTSIVFQSPKKMHSLRQSLEEISNRVEWDEANSFSGFYSTSFQRAFITEKDIFGIRQKAKSIFDQSNAEDFFKEFSDLKEGDYIVHDQHGVGIYRGLQTLEIGDRTSEFVQIEYADQDKLYLPIYRIDQISRYLSGDGFASPKLDRLGSNLFSKKRAKAKEDILKIAHELIDVAAKRHSLKIERSRVDEDSYQKFSNTFEYDPTPDQEKAIKQVETDLSQPNPMDRLVCGDVGFGKTEVALRASMFRILQNRQVALLAPTTLLVEQHFNKFKKRFFDFPVRIKRLSRFVKDIDQKKIVQELAEGRIDLIIGTHRLLQKDIVFKSLGLLIVDEEQRFGVKHKERIKKLKSLVDILTLSATPIPRTLQMAIAGIRDLSLIVTPPETREAVETRVGGFDESLIRNACQREIDRGGQILFVHNRIKSIYKLEARLKNLLPNLRIAVAHGQMRETELEDKMNDFIHQKYELLLATSIVENGIDIPNANTMFVDHAEQFGLSDLYQLRGRVGRSNRKAYCYFLIHENQNITADASKRLQVIQNCTELGSGFKVAAHDMEIRGSGNLLGEEQSGAIAEVGLELYNQMLYEALSTLRDEPASTPLPELNSGYSSYIPEVYIPDPGVRIATYRKLNRISSESELLNMEDELLDRFGLYPEPVDNLCQLIRLRVQAALLRAKAIDIFPGRLSLEMRSDTSLDPNEILKTFGKRFSFDPKGRLIFSFKSAMDDSELLKSTKFDRPEQYDFHQISLGLKELMSLMGSDSLGKTAKVLP
ncbi:MAG: transcription-repair coupling factor [Deltaproteobacteria bacterium CG11_big_fil_rev_8_21_14_0_20_45_16]|nr:MAG: transcription-repair coupling factor [Deltaproteobacteria bacterium CG11_big_fil_rev_8_21_14_0_20_45_16]